MRIIGGKDYYDSARAFGEDRETVFVRGNNDKAEFIDIPVVQTAVMDMKYYGRETVYYKYDCGFHAISVILAGVVYRGVSFSKSWSEPGKFVWSLDAWKTVEPFSKAKLTTLDRAYYHKDKHLRVWEDSIDTYFEPVKLQGDALDWIITNRVVIAINDRTHINDRKNEHQWKVNTDGLKAVGFQKAVDPYACFQELSMFVGGVLPRDGNPMVEITDNRMKIEKAGFDNKASFRHPV